MVVGLVVLFSLLQGITSIGSITRLKKIGRNTVLFYSFTTLIAISLGLGASLLLPAWEPLTSVATSGDDVQLISEDAAGGAAIASKLIYGHKDLLFSYQQSIFDGFNQYLKLHQELYGAEQRFVDSGFWQRRQFSMH